MNILPWIFATALAVPIAPALAAQGNPRLVKAPSPYLRLHANDLVKWYPWEEATFELARKRNLPVLASFGYTACHWCHVMQETHFNVPDIAKAINENFIPVIVDRERRPELDEAYMLVTEALTRRGGWPNTVFLTPERKPFYGTGYIAPDSFREILGNILNGWESQQQDLIAEAERLSELLENFMTRKAEAAEITPELMNKTAAELTSQFDEFSGGMGSAPKFFQQSILMYLLHQAERSDGPEAKAGLAAVELTLNSIISGGIHDHIEGGLHRYTVDPGWRIPHFEKMLYDQAMMTQAYSEAYRITGKPEYGHMARKIADYVLADLTDPKGGFYATRDADSEGEEGTFYVWTDEQLVSALGIDGATYAIEKFQIISEGELAGKLVLNLDNISAKDDLRVKQIFDKLAVARTKREKPQRDEKVVVNWNAMMISALARTSMILGDETYEKAAIKSAQFIWDNMRNGERKLFRSYFEGTPSIEAKLTDYAFLARAFLHLHDLTGGQLWLERANILFQTMEDDFSDQEVGDFFSTSSSSTTNETGGFGRFKSRQDSDLASANGTALEVATNLAQRTLGPESKRRTEKLIAALSGFANSAGGTSILKAADKFLRTGTGPVQYGGGGAYRVHAQQMEDETILLQIKMAPGWHINADKPLENYLIPTKVTLKTQEETEIAKIIYPEAEIKKLGFSEKPLALYEGTFDIRVETKNLNSKTSHIQLEIQTCSDQICLPPEMLNFKIAPPLPRG